MSHLSQARRPLNAAAPSVPAPRRPSLGGGQLLDRGTQHEMSARFGHNFSQIRIHTDHRAEESAQALGANAYALGSDIVFGAGKYQPGSRETERLLAHELTHVVQQAQFGPGDWGRQSRSGDASEREADTLSGQVLAGRRVQVQSAPGAALARDGDGTASANPEDHSTRDYLINMAATAGGFLPGPLGLAATAVGGAESIRQLPDQNDPNKDIKNVEGVAGLVNSIAGTAAGLAGFDGAAALGGSAASVAGGGGAGAAAMGPAALVAGAGLAGLATGHYLAENTEVGADTVSVLGGMDSKLTGAGERSAMLRLDEYRQDQWDAGGVGGVAKSIGVGVGEAGLGLVGALGGLGGGMIHGAEALGRGAMDLISNPNVDPISAVNAPVVPGEQA